MAKRKRIKIIQMPYGEVAKAKKNFKESLPVLIKTLKKSFEENKGSIKDPFLKTLFNYFSFEFKNFLKIQMESITHNEVFYLFFGYMRLFEILFNEMEIKDKNGKKISFINLELRSFLDLNEFADRTGNFLQNREGLNIFETFVYYLFEDTLPENLKDKKEFRKYIDEKFHFFMNIRSFSFNYFIYFFISDPNKIQEYLKNENLFDENSRKNIDLLLKAIHIAPDQINYQLHANPFMIRRIKKAVNIFELLFGKIYLFTNIIPSRINFSINKITLKKSIYTMNYPTPMKKFTSTLLNYPEFKNHENYKYIKSKKIKIRLHNPAKILKFFSETLRNIIKNKFEKRFMVTTFTSYLKKNYNMRGDISLMNVSNIYHSDDFFKMFKKEIPSSYYNYEVMEYQRTHGKHFLYNFFEYLNKKDKYGVYHLDKKTERLVLDFLPRKYFRESFKDFINRNYENEEQFWVEKINDFLILKEILDKYIAELHEGGKIEQYINEIKENEVLLEYNQVKLVSDPEKPMKFTIYFPLLKKNSQPAQLIKRRTNKIKI